MSGPPPATAAVRVAVRRCVAGLPEGATVLAAVSGGADSLALAAGLAFERPGSGAVVVDHGLQPGSGRVAEVARRQCEGLGLAAEVVTGTVAGGPGSGGPEGAAREVRYGLLEQAAQRRGAAAVLLGHTLDDQAETVLLGLARGSGARALAGMAARRGVFRRPLMDLTRTVTETACAEAGLVPWHDPHNADPRFARARVRHTVLPVLERELGPGTAASLARTAAQLREDADALDFYALTQLSTLTASGSALPVVELSQLPGAVLARLLKHWAVSLCDTAVGSGHILALRALVEDWHGQGAVALPGGTLVRRCGGRLEHVASTP